MNNNDHNTELQIPEDIATGKYANLAIISHSPSEFILDFASMLPGMDNPKVNSRIILTPEHAKRLMLSLQDNIAKYEGNFGAISSPSLTQQAQDQLINRPKMGEA